AYRLYTLALAGSSDLGSMNRLRETVGISNESKFRLAAAYAIIGQKKTALNLINGLTIESNNYYYYYGSEERNRAMLLETYLLVGEKAKAFDVATKLGKNLSSSNWMSTQTTAYSLYAMSKFAMANGGKGISVSLTQKGKTQPLTTSKSILVKTLGANTGNNTISLKNNGNNTLYVRVLNSGILPVGEEKEVYKNISSVITYKAKNGTTL